MKVTACECMEPGWWHGIGVTSCGFGFRCAGGSRRCSRSGNAGRGPANNRCPAESGEGVPLSAPGCGTAGGSVSELPRSSTFEGVRVSVARPECTLVRAIESRRICDRVHRLRQRNPADCPSRRVVRPSVTRIQVDTAERERTAYARAKLHLLQWKVSEHRLQGGGLRL